MEDDFIIFESPPSIIATLLHFDKLGLTQDRGCNIVVDTTQFLICYPVYQKKKKIYYQTFHLGSMDNYLSGLVPTAQ